jgi:hypothetical protein
MGNGQFGKKIFFLYPPPVLMEVVDELARQEFEVYLSKDHERLRRSIAAFPDSIVFINLDDGLDEDGWRSYIQSLRAAVPAVGIGIVCLNDNAQLREYYLMNAHVQCGFVILNIGAARTAEILTKTLEANEARGRRKFVRAPCSPGIGQCVVELEGSTLKADLTDLSSVGMALVFQGGASLDVGTVLHGMSLTIKGQRILASGAVVAKRASEGGENSVHVVIFDPGSLDEARRNKIKTLVFRINQAAINLIFERS